MHIHFTVLPCIAPWLSGSLTVYLHCPDWCNSNLENLNQQLPFSSSWESLKAPFPCTSALFFTILLCGGMETSHEKKKDFAGNNLILYLHFSTESNPLMIWGHFLLPVSFYASNIKKILKKILAHCSNNREGLAPLAPVMPENPTKHTDLSFTPPCSAQGLRQSQYRLVHAWAVLPNHCKIFYECNFSLIHISWLLCIPIRLLMQK